MGVRRVFVLLVLMAILCAGCTTRQAPPGITVTGLDTGDVPVVNVGNFDVYTDSFQIANPTNRSYENVEVAITLVPAVAYCHGFTKSFSYPQFIRDQKKIEQVSIAEFAGLGCQYSYTYTVRGENA